MKHYLTNILKIDTSSDDMNEKVEHLFDSFEKYNKKYIIMPSAWFNSYFTEYSCYITVRSPPGLINRENDTRCYFNETLLLICCNVLFRKLILNIDCFPMMISLDLKNKICQSLPKYHDRERVTDTFWWNIFSR